MEMQSRYPLLVLLIEDDPDDQLLFKLSWDECCSWEETRFMTLDNGMDFIHFLHREGKYADHPDYPEPDIIFLDLNLPGKHGIEILEELKSQGNQSFVVVWTTASDLETKEKCKALGADMFITKPPTHEQSKDSIWAVLDRFARATGEKAPPERQAVSRPRAPAGGGCMQPEFPCPAKTQNIAEIPLLHFHVHN